MEPNDTSKEPSFDMMKLAAGLNEMRDALVELSTLVKDYKATVDWDLHGEGFLKAMEAISQLQEELKGLERDLKPQTRLIVPSFGEVFQRRKQE